MGNGFQDLGGPPRRRRQMLPLGVVLNGAHPWLARLGHVRRLFATVVGPSRAADTHVKGVYGDKLLVLVRSEPLVRMLTEIEPFLLKTLATRVDGAPIRRVCYIVERGLHEEVRPDNVAVGPPVLDPVRREAVDRTVDKLPEGTLKMAMKGWMTAALANEGDARDA